MAYQTYTTDALVCGSFDRNTADRSYLLFTRDAGMLYASARNVREEKSRQRSALVDFSLVRVSLVKGKGGWKIGSVEARGNYYHQAVDKAARGSVVGWFRFLRRFVGAEEALADLFTESLTVLDIVSTPLENRYGVELLAKVRFLYQLGYVATPGVPEAILKPVQAKTMALDADTETLLEQLYAKAEQSSHL